MNNIACIYHSSLHPGLDHLKMTLPVWACINFMLRLTIIVLSWHNFIFISVKCCRFHNSVHQSYHIIQSFLHSDDQYLDFNLIFSICLDFAKPFLNGVTMLNPHLWSQHDKRCGSGNNRSLCQVHTFYFKQTIQKQAAVTSARSTRNRNAVNTSDVIHNL